MIELALNSFGFWITVCVVSLINALLYIGEKSKYEAHENQWLYTLIKSHGVIIPPKAEVKRVKYEAYARKQAKKCERISVISILISFFAMFGSFVTY